jgi:membrane protease YdiL (CAAX protease family)
MVGPIRNDGFTVALTVAGALSSLYVMTWELNFKTLMPFLLCVGGIALSRYTVGNTTIPSGQTNFKRVTFYFLVAVTGLAVSNYLANNALTPRLSSFDSLQNMIYGFTVGVGEEQFFRGFLTNYLIWRTENAPLAILGSGAGFTVFHFAVYGGEYNVLLYVMLAGMVLSAIAVKCGVLTPVMIAHITNNVVFSGVG